MTISNNEIKRIKSLQQKKFRDESGLFIVEGEKMVEEALSSGFEVEAVYRKDEIGETAMSRISSLASPSPVLAVVKKPADSKIENVNSLKSLISEGGLFLSLDTIRDPGNLGTILRIADWFGIKAVFASADTVDVFNPKVVQATMGAILRVRVHYINLAEWLAKQSGVKVYGTFLEGENIYSAGLDKSGVIVMGNEGQGISAEVANAVSHKLLIPPYPTDRCGSESLNVAVATAVICSEFRRR